MTSWVVVGLPSQFDRFTVTGPFSTEAAAERVRRDLWERQWQSLYVAPVDVDLTHAMAAQHDRDGQ